MSAQRDQVKRTFPKVVRAKVFGAVKSAGNALHNEGIIFWSNEATAVSRDDDGKGTHYSQISLGHAAVVNDPAKIKRILEIINEGRETPLTDTGIRPRGKKSTAKVEQ